MYKASVIGHFAYGKEFLDGQTVKTKVLADELKLVFGSTKIKTIDTYNWKKNMLGLLFNCLHMMAISENIIILPAQNGVRIFLPFLIFFNLIFKRRIHYVAIGGWLPNLLFKDIWLRKWACMVFRIYVETRSMMKLLKELGLQNVVFMPNFKRLKILNDEELVYIKREPFKLCTFSRVMREKGIEDAVYAVTRCNEILGKEMYYLDIYGQIDEGYTERFANLIDSLPDYIRYKGVVNYSDSVMVLQNYFALLFPTYYEGEGFAGTILDAFASGIPIIASNWKYNAEIIENGINGIIYDCGNNEQLVSILLKSAQNPNLLNNMKMICLRSASRYSAERVIREFVSGL